jgi:transposase
MSYLRGPDRSEVQLLPPCLEDYVPANAPARFIDAYVEGLDFAALGFTHARPRDTGRPPCHPADLLKLYLYGYLHRVRSSRRLEAEAARNLEVVWLLRQVRPDFKTIADFRKDNRAAFQPLFKDFNLLCRSLDRFGAELVAIDGAKFKASKNPRRHDTQEHALRCDALHSCERSSTSFFKKNGLLMTCDARGFQKSTAEEIKEPLYPRFPEKGVATRDASLAPFCPD